MNRLLIAVSLLASVPGLAQPLRDINYNYLYDPAAIVAFHLTPVRAADAFTVLYSLEVADTAGLDSDYSIMWEGREMLSDRDGKPLVFRDEQSTRTRRGVEGRGSIPLAEAPRYVMARVTKNSAKRAWLFYVRLDEKYPVNNFLVRNGTVVHDRYIGTDEPVSLGADSLSWIVSYYGHDFPAAAPAFSEAQARVSARLTVDSVFTVASGKPVVYPRKGLYLVQRDTTALEGFAFRAEDDYPQYSRLANLPGPLTYISTRQENERLQASRGNKKAFDRIVLSMVNDTERARTLMRSYFRRVELANRYFTSYKEGWKTDRGMIYIIFGKPDAVYRFDDREVWSYDNDLLKMRFDFSRAPTLFDPDNMVLIREKKFEDEWYEVIDLWRNARF